MNIMLEHRLQLNIQETYRISKYSEDSRFFLAIETRNRKFDRLVSVIETCTVFLTYKDQLDDVIDRADLVILLRAYGNDDYSHMYDRSLRKYGIIPILNLIYKINWTLKYDTTI